MKIFPLFSPYGYSADAMCVYNTVFNALKSIQKPVVNFDTVNNTFIFCNREEDTIGGKNLLSMLKLNINQVWRIYGPQS